MRMVSLESGESLIEDKVVLWLTTRFIASYGAALDVVRLAKEYRDESGSTSKEANIRARL